MIKSFICSTLVLLLVIVGPAWSAQRPGGHLNITEVLVDYTTIPTSIMIMGEDLDFGGELDVTLGDNIGSLNVTTESPTVIVADLPPGLLDDYLLTVSRGEGQSQNDEYDLTIGAVGLKGDEGDQGDQGPQGNQGTQGPTGPTGAAGPQGPKGETGATGDTGQPGEQGDTAAVPPESDKKTAKNPRCGPNTGFLPPGVTDRLSIYWPTLLCPPR